MRFGKKVWMILAIGIFLIGVISLGLAYLQQDEERNQLTQELALAQTRLIEYPSSQPLVAQKDQLESQLGRMGRQLENTKALLDRSIESIEAIDTLYLFAEQYHLEITEVSSPGLVNKTPGGVAHTALELVVGVSGEPSDIVGYIRKISIEFPTSVVSWVEVNVPEIIEGQAEEEIEMPSASLYLIIHTYEGD
ncbi:hypothetical protein ACFLUE_02180 [Chloroflexota bacterium]